jgi:hypothetical protein
LGGLSAKDERMTRWGALVRSDDPSKLTAEGWEALWDYGIRTIISLRTIGKIEYKLDMQVIPSGVDIVSIAIEDLDDTGFVQKWVVTNLWGTPLYYHDALMRWPKQHAEVVSTFACAQAGGVLIHCSRGNDRTGIISLLLLALVGVSPEDIVTDYELSPDIDRDDLLSARGTSSHKVILDTLANIDVETYLLKAGLSQSDLEVAKERLLDPAPPGVRLDRDK